jgi:hypothetical protein
MKKVIFSLVCFSLVFGCLKPSAAAAAKDSAGHYHLVQSQIADEVPLRGPVDSATVYVLVCPDQRVYVFRAFHSHPMEEIIKHFPRGSVLHYDGNALAAPPPEAQMRALTASCKSKGIEFVLTPTN